MVFETCFIIINPPILYVCFLQNLSMMNILDSIFYCMLSTIFASDCPPPINIALDLLTISY
jgi:hypothetical protein